MLNRSQSKLDLCECYVSGVCIRKKVGKVLCYLGNVHVGFFLKGKTLQLGLTFRHTMQTT